jgi:hypothetical protein
MGGTTWVYIMLGLYIIYCFYWGLKGYFTEKTSSGYAIAGRSIPFFAFLLAATAASFSGWTFIGHPGLIWRDGLAYAFASFYVLTIPITGTFFSKRTWLLGKRYGFITPGDMYAYYFNSEPLRFSGRNYSGAILYFLLCGTADGLCGLVQCYRRRTGHLRCHLHGLHRLVLCLYRRSEGQHLGRRDPVHPAGGRHHYSRPVRCHLRTVRRLVGILGIGSRIGCQVP